MQKIIQYMQQSIQNNITSAILSVILALVIAGVTVFITNVLLPFDLSFRPIFWWSTGIIFLVSSAFKFFLSEALIYFGIAQIRGKSREASLEYALEQAPQCPRSVLDRLTKINWVAQSIVRMAAWTQS